MDIHAYARLGATIRYKELRQELDAILKQFPGINRSTNTARRRSTLSAATRKSISIRMKKYWAERRAKKGH